MVVYYKLKTMFKMKLFILKSIFLIPFLSFAQTEIAGVTFPDTIQIENDKAILSGVGIKKRVWVKEYAIGLYHNESTTNADKIIQSKRPMGIRIQVLQDFMAKSKFTAMVQEKLKKSNRNIPKHIKTKIDYFLSLMDKHFMYNDTLEILYHPDTGVNVYINSKLKWVIEGNEFKEGLYGIWLDDQCADKKLKKDLLANTR